MVLLEFFKTRLTTFRWIIGGFIAAFAVIGGLHWSSLFFLVAAILMLPLFPRLQKNYIVATTLVLASIALFFGGFAISPLGSHKSFADKQESTIQAEDAFPNGGGLTSSEIEEEVCESSTQVGENMQVPDADKNGSGESSAEENLAEQTTTQDADEDSENLVVWVSGSGKKYHLKSTCSGMKEPQSMLIEEAAVSGYEPCKKCCK